MGLFAGGIGACASAGAGAWVHSREHGRVYVCPRAYSLVRVCTFVCVCVYVCISQRILSDPYISSICGNML